MMRYSVQPRDHECYGFLLFAIGKNMGKNLVKSNSVSGKYSQKLFNHD